MKKLFPFLKFITPVFLFLIIPIVAEGFALDLAIMQLEAISEKTSPFMAFFVLAFIVFALGLAALYISTSLLQSVIEISSEALTVMGGNASPMVEIGWNFTVGIGNMLLIIAFVVIAFSTILGYENYHFKKLLPRLVVVALLMNFTLLFVGMGIDVSNFLFNSVGDQFAVDGGNILFEAIAPLLDLGTKSFYAVLGMFAGIVLSLLVPYANVAVQVLFVISFAAFFPVILELLITGFIMLSFSLLFFLFFVVFLARIFIIQILAVAAPLAFFCLIFDETKQYWTLWLKHLIQWLFVGVVFIFLMYLGLALAPMTGEMINPLTDNFPLWLRFFGVNASVFSHIVLLVYFAIIFAIAKSFIPAAANALISQGSSIIKAASPYMGAIARGGQKGYRREIVSNEKIQSTAKAWESTSPVSGGGVFGGVKNIGRFMKRSVGGSLSSGAIDSENKDLTADMKKLEGTSANTKINQVHGSSLPRERLAAILQAWKDDQIDELAGVIDNDEDYKKLHTFASALGKNSGLEKAIPEAHCKASGINNKEEMQKFIEKRFSKADDVGKISNAAIKAFNSNDAFSKLFGDVVIGHVIASPDISVAKKFNQDSSGASGQRAMEAFLTKFAKSNIELAKAIKDNNNQITPEILGRALSMSGPALASHMAKNPHSVLSGVIVPKNNPQQQGNPGGGSTQQNSSNANPHRPTGSK